MSRVDIESWRTFEFELDELKAIYHDEWEAFAAEYEADGEEPDEKEFVYEIIWEGHGGDLDAAPGFTHRAMWDADDADVKL